SSKARIHRIDEGTVTRVLPPRPHVVGDVAERDARLRIAKTERAAGAEMAERAVVGTEGSLGLGELEAETEAGYPLVDQIEAVRVLGRGLRDRLRLQDANAVDRSAACERRVD